MHLIALLFVLIDARHIEKEVTLNAPVASVWKAWTTEEGAKVFFAPASRIEMRPGGAYEMYFVPSLPAGQQGGEGNRVIDFQREKFLLITWNAPPKFGALRDERTFVLVTFDRVGDEKTRVRLTHFGWREGAGWNDVYAYFDKAWDVVLGRLSGVDFSR
jgi:uncharacterized protein YndB with AHSA1/START domain